MSLIGWLALIWSIITLIIYVTSSFEEGSNKWMFGLIIIMNVMQILAILKL